MSTQDISITCGYLKEIEYAFAIGNIMPSNNLLSELKILSEIQYF